MEDCIQDIGFAGLIASVFTYNTIKTVRVKNKKVGAVFRIMQIAIILYVLVVAIYLEKGYQGYDYATAYTSTKLKGLGVTCRQSGVNLTACSNEDIRVWDVVDYTQPALENGAFFVVTNSLAIPNQV